MRAPAMGCLLAMLACTLFQGCDQTEFDPFAGEGEKYFTVYGFLDEMENDHTLRVIPVSRRGDNVIMTADPGTEIDARVFTTEVLTGSRKEWTHELAQLDDGTYGHIFRARFNVRPRQVYRLEVIREDGKMTTAETRVPYIPGPFLYERGPEIFSPDSTELYQDIHIPEIPSPWDIKAVYGWVIETAGRRVHVDYGRVGIRTSDGGWDMRLNYSQDQGRVHDDVRRAIEDGLISPNADVWLGSAGVLIRILDQNWDPPEGNFDPEALAQPGALSNVENGYGLFGSIGTYIEEWSAVHLSASLGFDK